MFSSRPKTLVIVAALLMITSLMTVGCQAKGKKGWVNTASLPGHAYSKYTNQGNAKRNTSTVIYLGSDDNASEVDFGPRDVSFEFKSLK